MSDFKDYARSLTKDGQFMGFDSLAMDEQMALVGLYLLEEYKPPYETEAIVESLCPNIGGESKHAIALYGLMASGWGSNTAGTAWGWKLATMIVHEYSGLVAEAVEKAIEPDHDEIYDREMDRRAG